MNASISQKICSHLRVTVRPFLSSATRRAFQELSRNQLVASQVSRFSHSARPSFFRLPPKSTRYALSRRFASGGFLVAGVSPSSCTESAVNACANTVEASLLGNGSCHTRRSIAALARSGWKRDVHTGGRRRNPALGRRSRSSTTKSNDKGQTAGAKEDSNVEITSSKDVKRTQIPTAPASEANKHLLNRLPHIPQIHRPTKEELLAAATGFWSRLKVRFKWFSIRSLRPFNVDDISAFFSWILLGHVIWIILGTTTFFSLAILAVNTVFAQETLARWIGNYLTKSSGIKVVFESAIVPSWSEGVITFRNVFVSRRPGQGKAKVSKGSSVTAAAAAAAAAAADKEKDSINNIGTEVEEDTNYTQFDVSIDTVNVTLSFAKWFNGKGLLRDVEVKGVRGVVDRTGVQPTPEDVDPRSFKHEHNPGDFEIDSFKMEDLLVTVHQPGGFRPFSVSIFACDLPQLRKQWLFYDFLSANTMSGSFDNSLFTIHPRQIHGYTGTQLPNGLEAAGEGNPWKKHSRIRIDGLNIDHLNRGVEGPFSWIQQGNVDIVADIMFPTDDDASIVKVMSDFYDRMEATVTSNRYLHLSNGPSDIDKSLKSTEENLEKEIDAIPDKEDDRRFVVMDVRVNLNDVRAAVPLFTTHLSYVNNALIRPIVAYINSRRTFIPINCRVVKRMSEFDGSWTVFDSGLMQDLSAETYEAFARTVTDEQARIRRLKKVGLWSIQLAVQAIFMGMAGNIA